jgi:hypothetical protein
LGWLLDASECYYDYRNYQRENKHFGLSKILDTIAWLYCGYGVRPWYTVFWIALFIIIFGIIFNQGDGIRRSRPPRITQDTLIFKITELGDHTYKLIFKQEKPERGLSFKDAIFFSATTFASKDTGCLYPDESHVFIAKVERIVGGFLFGLFVVFFTGALRSYFLQP